MDHATLSTLVFNSDQFTVVELAVPVPCVPGDRLTGGEERLSRGGYEIVDKFARQEIYLEGVLAQHFRAGVEELARGDPTPEQVEELIGRFTGLPRQPLVLH